MANMQSIGASIQNMLVAATDLNIGGLWICDIFFAYEELVDWINIDGQLVASMAFGYTDENPQKRPRKNLDKVVTWRGYSFFILIICYNIIRILNLKIYS
jgi:nitroreductase